MTNVLQLAIEAHQRQDLAVAKRRYEQAIAVAHHNLGVLAEQTGQHGEAQARYRQALAIDPGRDESAYDLSLSLLREGRYAEAWPLHERRRGLARLKLPIPGPQWPEWTGGDLAGRRLAVLGEQGMGDQIMFARFHAPLRAMGAEVVFVGAPPLARLLDGRTELRRSEVDAWVLQGSLPHRLGATLETLPPPAALPVRWRGGGGIGVMAAGAPGFSKDAQRSLPEGLRRELHALGRDLSPEATGAGDFLDTAEIIAGLDLVITVDTSVAHLAGSMGAPTWVLLPAVNADWRWLRGREDSPWYASVRLMRQPAPGDWAGLLAKIRAELA